MSTTIPSVHDTMVMRDDGTTVKDAYCGSPADYESSMYADIGDLKNHSIHDFLGRPVIIAQGTWGSQAKGAVLNTFTFPKDLLYFQTGAPAVGTRILQNTNKLDGFVALKAKVHIKVEVNSMPFQAGALMLNYIPYSEYMQSHAQWYATPTNVSPPTSGTANLTACTGCPHIIMNLANTTSMEFVTPYISPYLYFNLATGQGSFGTANLIVMSPVSSQAASSVSYTVWAWMEDIKLFYPTPAPLTTSFAQVGKELAVLEQRQTISGTVGAVGRGIASVLPWVGLGWLSSPTAALAEGSEKVLKMLGFSKPTIEAPITRVKQSPSQYFFNCDGADASHMTSLSAENSLTQMSGWAGTDIDEMRFDYICSIPCYKETFTWSGSTAADTSIYTAPVSPLWNVAFDSQIANAYARTLNMPLCAKVASYFSLWRGTMVFTFRFVKTQFHSGRIRVSFIPYAYADSTTVQTMPSYAHTQDIDLSSGTDFEFEVKYCANRPWLFTYFDPSTSIVSGDARNSASGIVQISVINPLISAPTVSSSIEVLVSVSMREAQFASPVRNIILPYGIPNVAQVGKAQAVPMSSENGIDLEMAALSLLPYGATVGEPITSFRQLLKRNSYLGRIQMQAMAATTTTPGQTGNAFAIFPWAPIVPQNGTITVAGSGAQTPKYNSLFTGGQYGTSTFNMVTDNYSSVYSMYAFMRGSIRYKFVVAFGGGNYAADKPMYVYINNMINPSVGNYSPNMLIASPVGAGPSSNLGSGPIQPVFDIPANTSGTLKTGFTYQPGLAEPRMVVFPDKEGIIEIHVVYQASGPFVPTNYGLNNPTNSRSQFVPFPTVTITGTTNAANSAPTLLGCTIDIFRSVGDDFSFGGRLGAPQHAMWQSGVDPT